MEKSRYPTLHKNPHTLEVVDRLNIPICIMSSREVLRQHLTHRMTALLLRDSAGRVLLTFQPKFKSFSFSSIRRVYAGQSYEARAQAALRDDWNLTDKRLRLLGLYPPCTENRHAFTAIFEVRLRAAQAEAISRNQDHYLLLDYDELKGLNTHSREILAPFMRVAIQKGYVRPQ